jgi:hypothetical protein
MALWLEGTGVRLGVRFNPRHGNQCESKIAHLHQHPIERCLIAHGSPENRFTVVRVGELDTIKPVQPTLVELAFDSNFISDRACLHVP